MDAPLTGLELRSLIRADETGGGGTLQLSLVDATPGEPGPDELVVRVEAAPINPSDIGLLLGPADLSTLKPGGSAQRPTLTAAIPQHAMAAMRMRLEQSLPVGNEGAGTVVRAGANVSALAGRTVGMMGGGMYTQFRRLPAKDCSVLPDGTSAADGASMFINPLTALGFVETMRMEGHRAIVQTAAASNLGQMLGRICLADGIPLVNIVRSERQAANLRAGGARHVVDSNAPGFDAMLAGAIAETGATLAFDAIGGGRLAGQILNAMEAAASRNAAAYSRYGSGVFKQVYVYGALDTGPTIVDRSFGMTWGLGGWLLFPFMQKAGHEVITRLRERVRRELTTTFASRYSAGISLADALKPEIVEAYQRRATGEKYLIVPHA